MKLAVITALAGALGLLAFGLWCDFMPGSMTTTKAFVLIYSFLALLGGSARCGYLIETGGDE